MKVCRWGAALWWMGGDLGWESSVRSTAREKGLVGTAQATVTGRAAAEAPSEGETGCYQGINMTTMPMGRG